MGEGISIFNMERLTRFIKEKVGNGKRFDCIPAFVPNPPLHTVDSIHKLMIKYPKGSNPYRKLLAIESQGKTPFNPQKWKLHDGTVTYTQIKNAFKRCHSNYLTPTQREYFKNL